MRLPPLHDVRDPEALCRSVLKSVLDGNGGFFSAEDREEILQDMRMLILRLADGYDRKKTAMTFSTYSTWILKRRIGVDVYRQRLVDLRYHSRRPLDLSLEELRERLDQSILREQSDEAPLREQNDLLTRFALAVSVTDVSPREALENWVAYLTPTEAVA